MQIYAKLAARPYQLGIMDRQPVVYGQQWLLRGDVMTEFLAPAFIRASDFCAPVLTPIFFIFVLRLQNAPEPGAISQH